MRTHVDDEDKIKFEEVKRRQIHAPIRRATHILFIINKSGLISLVLCSKKAEAKAFKRWITTEVIPAILSTGGYIPTEPSNRGDEKSHT
jgi:prophage antirepressor-like protein